jgi:citrate synthase
MLLSARETADRLGIKIETLYAYVSRGLIKSAEIGGSRERRYDAEEVDRFCGARGGGRSMRAEPEALMPVIGSSICLIENHRIYYRGQDALRLADTATLEEIAVLLWEDAAPASALPRPRKRGTDARDSERLRTSVGLIERCQIRLAELSNQDLAALDLGRAGVIRTGRRILAELAAAVAGATASPLPVHEQLAAQWRLDARGGNLVRRCLVLLADHELNASTFVARCVASTRATPYAVVSAALAALSGRRHGGASARAEALFRELGTDPAPLPALAARLARGERLPGLGQPLYPQGDPRCAAIIAALAEAVPEAGARIAAAAVAARELTGEHPNVDFALGGAATALNLPPGSALGIFLVARSVGWIAHAIEQYESGVLIRPRARYTGRR